jgi:hypothetical protein
MFHPGADAVFCDNTAGAKWANGTAQLLAVKDKQVVDPFPVF